MAILIPKKGNKWNKKISKINEKNGIIVNNKKITFFKMLQYQKKVFKWV